MVPDLNRDEGDSAVGRKDDFEAVFQSPGANVHLREGGDRRGVATGRDAREGASQEESDEGKANRYHEIVSWVCALLFRRFLEGVFRRIGGSFRGVLMEVFWGRLRGPGGAEGSCRSSARAGCYHFKGAEGR